MVELDGHTDRHDNRRLRGQLGWDVDEHLRVGRVAAKVGNLGQGRAPSQRRRGREAHKGRKARDEGRTHGKEQSDKGGVMNEYGRQRSV